MTRSDFLAAIDVQVVRWQFQQIVERGFEQSDPVTGLVATESPEVSLRLASSGDLLGPIDDGTPARETPGSVNSSDL